MQVAEILSDLTSLRVCGHSEALALVSVHKQQSTTGAAGLIESTIDSKTDGVKENRDLQRAKDLVELHNDITLKRLQGGAGPDEELEKARSEVSRVLQELETSRT